MSEDILRLTSDLYTFVREVETALSRPQPQLKAKLDQLQSAAEELSARCDAARARGQARALTELGNLKERLHELREEFRAQKPDLTRLKAKWAALGHHYEGLVAQLPKASIRIPESLKLSRLKPKNYARNFFHFANSAWAIALYQYTADRDFMLGVAGFFLLVAVSIEVSRKFSTRLNAWFCDGLFGSVARPHELHNITAATWYALAMVIGVYFFPQHAVEAGALVLGIGDPIASIVGKTWGKTKVWGEKSLEGSLGFFGVATLALAFYFTVIAGGYSLTMVALASVLVALAGPLTELFSGRIEDNFSIPLASGAIAMFVLALPL
ncbi:MAG: SEC59/DGK1/VTE5 family protein [Myxococcota bacterium]|nr:SEC59/DGK1/VTE5 family protein [Myxococcota bacterium]